MSGEGKVYEAGEYLTDVSYEIQVFEDLRSASGEIEILGEDKKLIYHIFNTNHTTTLHLEDGRQADFMIEEDIDFVQGKAPIKIISAFKSTD
jgi:hypothetical protein